MTIFICLSYPSIFPSFFIWQYLFYLFISLHLSTNPPTHPFIHPYHCISQVWNVRSDPDKLARSSFGSLVSKCNVCDGPTRRNLTGTAAEKSSNEILHFPSVLVYWRLLHTSVGSVSEIKAHTNTYSRSVVYNSIYTYGMILSYCPVRTVHHMQRGQNRFFCGTDMLKFAEWNGIPPARCTFNDWTENHPLSCENKPYDMT